MGRILSLDKATFTRASDAFNPYTGAWVRPDVLRRVPSSKLRVLKRPFRASDSVDFAAGITRMTYAQLLTRMTTFEGIVGGWATKTVIGVSTSGRDIVMYTMGNTALPGILYVTAVHGNEVNGAEGQFKFFETLYAKRTGSWKAILDEHHIRWVVAANPDGWNDNQRNLDGVGPNGQTVNLNRQSPWFWPNYIESGAESKGAAPAGEVGAEPEADALFDLVTDEDNNIEIVIDHHANDGQGHPYESANRVNSANPARFNKDWDVRRATAVMRRFRGLIDPADEEPGFSQFRRSKSNPHFHSWASGIGKIAMALESRKDDPGGPTAACKWNFDSSFAVCVAFTEAWWRYEETIIIERAATNLVTGQDTAYQNWISGGALPNGYSRSRCTVTRLKDQALFPMNGRVSLQIEASLDVTPLVAGPDWKLVSLGDIVLAVGRYDATQVQRLRLATETVETTALGPDTPLNNITRGAALVLLNVDFACAMIGGWEDDGNTLRATAQSYSAFNPGVGFLPDSGLAAARADAGFANDGSRYSAIVGGSVGTVSSPFVADVDGKIFYFDRTLNGGLGGCVDSTLTIPARKHALVVHQPGTDKFWIFGGEDAAGNQFDDIWVYDRAAGTVTEHGTTLPDEMSRIAGAAYKTDCIYLYGGRAGSPGDYTNGDKVYKFVPSSGALTEESVLANIEDEASHDETPFVKAWHSMSAARRVAGNGEEIFIAGGKVGPDGDEEDQTEFYVHRPASNTITLARDGTYALLSKATDIDVAEGEWISMSCWAKAVTPVVLDKPPYFRACLTFKNNAGTWLRHARTYYETPFPDEFQEFRTASPVKAGETKVRPYWRLYTHQAKIIVDRMMVCKRSRPSSFHYGTRAAEKLTFSEPLNMDNFRVEFTWNPTFGFVNVGEDLELARIEQDAQNYISLVLIQDTGKTYHSGTGLVGAQFPKVELRKVVSNVLTKTIEQSLDYGYDGRSSNQEAYNDPTRFGIEHSPLGGLAFTVERYGQIARVEDREFDNAYGPYDPGFLIYEGEGRYGVPQLMELKRRDPRRDSSCREAAKMASHASFTDVLGPGWANAT